MQFFRLIHLIRYLTITLLILSNSLLAADYKVTLLNEDDGFDSSVIFSIVQDKQGFLWFGSGYEGVYRYDGKKVKAFKHQVGNNNSLPHDNAGNLFIDNADKLWIGSWGGGVSQYDPQSSSFIHYPHNPDDISTVSDAFVQEIFQDSQGELWLGTFKHGLNKFNPTTQTFTRYPFDGSSNQATSSSRVWDITQTDEDSIWIATSNGLNHFDKRTNTFSTYLLPKKKGQIIGNEIKNLLKTDDGNLLLGTQIGVWLFNIDNKSFTPVNGQSKKIIGDIFSIIKTSFNQYWVATRKGIFSFSLADLTLKKVNLGVNDLGSHSLFEDREGIIWLSCEGVGIYKIVPNNTVNLLTNDLIELPQSALGLNNDTLLIGTKNYLLSFDSSLKKPTRLKISGITQRTNIFQSKNDDIWYVSLGNLYRLNTQGVQQILPPLTDPNKTQFNNIKAIGQDTLDRIWVGTLHNGVFIIDDLNRDFIHLSAKNTIKGLSHNDISSIYRDRDDRMWISTAHGVNLFIEQTQQFRHFYFDKSGSVDNPTNISNVIFQDSKKRIWVGSSHGLHLLNEDTGNYTSYDVTHGLANDNVNSIIEDDYGYLWLLSDVGISKFNPENNRIRNYDSRDGFSNSRNFSSLTSSSSGIIYFTSQQGVHSINPHSIHELDNIKNQSNTVLTHFELLGAKQKEQPYYPPQISAINLAPDENTMKFEFVTLDFTNSKQIKYSYKLEGFNEQWVDNDNNNSAIFTNLDGGDYTFKVRSLYRDNEFYQQGLSIKLSVETPIWQRWWMVGFYCAVILLFILQQIKGKSKKQQLEIVRQKTFVTELEQQVKEKTSSLEKKTVLIEQESSKRLEATQVKSQFLANMSHEIRTPLTSIIGQLEAIIHDEVDPRDLHAEVEIIYNHSNYLLNLINEILDLSKIEANKFDLNIQEHNVSELIDELNPVFKEQAKAKGLLFKITYNIPENYYIKLDQLRLKQILINLCANAIKFTTDGAVSLDVSLKNDQLFFHVCDTGIGMNDEQLLHIFDAFSQGDNSISRRFGGTGLGLNLSEQLAEKMGGYIQVESELGKGSVFSLVLPYVSYFTKTAKLDNSAIEPSISYNHLRLQGTILLAEDHHDNRRLITRLLKKLGLEVIAVSNGQEAVDMYFKHQPPVILLDIQMPVMDGIDAIKVLKERGCKAKVIALTANAMRHEINEYLALGFDDHLKKPIERNKFIATIAQYYRVEVPLNDEQVDDFEHSLSQVDMSDLVERFFESLADEHENILFHQEKNDLDSIAKQAHQLAGAAQIFGFAKLADCAIKVELAIKNNDVNNVESLTKALIDKLDNMLEFQSV